MPEDLMTATATADGDQLETQDTQVSEQVETGDTGLETGEQQTEQTQTPPEKTFTQAQLDEIIQKRLSKEQARFENEKKSAAQQARDEWIASQGYEWKGKHIATEAEYNEALKEYQMEQEILQKYAYLPEDVQSELLENRKFREQYQSQQKIIQEQQRRVQQERDFVTRRDAMYAEFLEEFPDQNTEEAWAKIPAEVWAEADRWLKTGGREGRRLADALTRYNWKQAQAQQQANDANSANANASTGSVKGQAKSGAFFTREQVANMSREEIRTNYNAIKESEKHWK